VRIYLQHLRPYLAVHKSANLVKKSLAAGTTYGGLIANLTVLTRTTILRPAPVLFGAKLVSWFYVLDQHMHLSLQHSRFQCQ
jgi:hypothetical protein